VPIYGDKVEVVLAGTPFYVESGGQVSDMGVIAKYSEQGGEPIWGIDVMDVRRPLPGIIVHVGEVSVGEPKVNDDCWRWSITIGGWTSCAIIR